MEPDIREKRKIYIVLTNTGTLFTRAIRLYTRAPYNHTGIGLNKSLVRMYSFGRKKPRNPFIGGFVCENRNSGVYRIFKDTECAVYSMEIDREIYLKIKNNIKIFKDNREKYKYNLIGLLGVVFGLPVNRNYAYFCSQFVATILRDSGIDLFGKDPALVTPVDFEQSSSLTLIYKGKLRDYCINTTEN